MRQSATRLGLLGFAALGIMVAACSSTNDDALGTSTAAVDTAIVAKTHVVTITCEAAVVPECVDVGWVRYTCGEGHDELYTAYVVEPSASGTPSWREVIHHECAQGRPCPQDSIPVPLTHTVRTEPLCPGESAAKTKNWTIADDDGCMIACAGGDNLCCTALATGVAPEFNWVDVTTINARVECTGDTCTGAYSGSNRGTGSNQLAGVTCTFTDAIENAPERKCN